MLRQSMRNSLAILPLAFNFDEETGRNCLEHHNNHLCSYLIQNLTLFVL